MVEQNTDQNLSLMLKAMGDATRRSLLTQLCQHGPSRVTDLAGLYDMSLNAISKHIKVLEAAGLVMRKTIGRVHWIEADLLRTEIVANWLSELRLIWELRLDKLDELLSKESKTNE